MMEIRKWQKNDLPRLADIAEKAMPFPWTLRVFQDCLKMNYVGWVIEEERKIIGFSIILVQSEQVEIINIALLPEFQKKGGGRQLLNEILNYCRECEIPKINLEVRKSNRSAITFYRKFGFKEDGIRKNYYPLSEGREDGLLFSAVV
jgi:ribosomal-protein-alanine N-acetyltransferase